MKLNLDFIRRRVLPLLLVSFAGSAVCAQTDLPYSSGSTGVDGPLTFRTIPVGGRYGHSLAYDAVRKKTDLFGGYNPNVISGGYLGDTWTFDGTNWIQLNPTTTPSRRYGAKMLYAPWNGGEVVLFGGITQNGQRSDETWIWNGTTWTQANPATKPSPRSTPAMAYDAARDKIVLFSGAAASNDTWLFDGTTWTLAASQVSPPSWDQHIAAYDAERKQVVLVSYEGTWVWNGQSWSKATPVQDIPQSGNGGIAYDAVRKETVVFGGSNKNHTFVWTGSNWIQRNPTTVPPLVSSTEMVFDSTQGKIVRFGGQVSTGDSFSGDTWTWDGTDWTFVSGRTQFFDMTGRANGIWNFTTINVPSGITVQFTKNSANTPVRWLSQGNVQIDGVLNLDGGMGSNDLPEGVGGAGGPGAFDGGHGGIRLNRSGSYVGSPGQGPGGGLPGTQPANDGNIRDGKGALFATTPGGYGNIYLQPLIGGSGGGGGSSSDTVDGGNGGGGGGALLIASSRDIAINGAIYSRGGQIQWSGASQGGRGSGGGVLLRADRISGGGTLDATPDGRIRFEAYYRTLAGSTQPTSVNSAPVASADFATTGTLNIASIKGLNVQQPPSGNPLTPDVIFTDAGPVNVVVQGSNVPNGTPVTLRITTTSGVITPPVQNMNNNSATFSVTVPKGIGTLQAFATFTIQ
jgi:hypothetical protein